MSGIGSRLLEVRKKTGLNQAEFGQLFDLSDRGYKNYEQEIRDLPVKTAIQICTKFKISANWLLLGHGAKDVPSLSEALAKAKVLARQYRKSSDRVFDDQKITELESTFLKYLLDAGEASGEPLTQLLGGLNEV